MSRGQAIAASPVARAKAVLAVADGHSYTDAARAAGCPLGDAVAALVARFNAEGLAAVVPRQGGGHPRDDTSVERERILADARRPPDRECFGRRNEFLSFKVREIGSGERKRSGAECLKMIFKSAYYDRLEQTLQAPFYPVYPRRSN